MASKDETQHFVGCDLCQQPVSFFCRRCGVNLCDPCVIKHLRSKSKNGHDIVDYTSKDDDDTCHCDSHPENDCSAYCKTCDTPICILCVSIKHRLHEISELSDKINELIKIIEKENVRLQSSKHELERFLDHTTKLLSSIPSIYQQRKDEVTATGKEWHKQIEKTVMKLNQELDDMQKEHEAALQKQIKDFKEMIGIMDDMNGKTIKLKKSKNVKEMETFVTVIKKQKNLSNISQHLLPKFYECKIDENFFPTNFGHIEKMGEKQISLLKDEHRDKEFGRKMLDVIIVTSVIDTRFPASKKQKNRLYDMAVTSNKKVWMGGNSNELKLFDLQGHLRQTVAITSKGMFLCMHNKHVVYTDILDNAVKMISDTNTVVTMFTTGEWQPCGVTSTSSGYLLICLRKDDQSKVVRFSSTGTVLQEIQYDSKCHPLYKEATYITENVNGDIIVTDWEKKAVIAVDRFGIFRYLYSGRDSDFNAMSVTADSTGYVIITDRPGNKIHMLDRNGKFQKYIIPVEGIHRPRAVCIIGPGEMMVGECLTGFAKRINYLEKSRHQFY